jgi:alkaline phosphatase
MAFGPGAENFQGFLDNTDIAKIIYRLKDIK